MSHYIRDSLGNVWPVEMNLLVSLEKSGHFHTGHGTCDCGKDIPHHKGKPLCPHCKSYQGEGGCNDCECLEGEK